MIESVMTVADLKRLKWFGSMVQENLRSLGWLSIYLETRTLQEEIFMSSYLITH
jgi:hypothetical protein